MDQYPNVREIRLLLDQDSGVVGHPEHHKYTKEYIPHSLPCLNPACRAGGLPLAQKVNEKTADMVPNNETDGRIDMRCHGWERMGKLPRGYERMDRKELERQGLIRTCLWGLRGTITITY